MTKLSELGLLLLKDLIADLRLRGDQIEAVCLAQLLERYEQHLTIPDKLIEAAPGLLTACLKFTQSYQPERAAYHREELEEARSCAEQIIGKVYGGEIMIMPKALAAHWQRG